MRTSVLILVAVTLSFLGGCEKDVASNSPKVMTARTVYHQDGVGGVQKMTGKLTVTFYDHYVEVAYEKGDKTVIPSERLVEVNSGDVSP